jgi:hypothetical protein
MKKLILLSATLGALHLSNTTYAQIQSIKFDPVGNYLGVLFPVSHTNPFSGTYVVSAYFRFDITLDSTGVRAGTGIGNVFVGGKRTNFTLASFVAPTLTIIGGNPVLNTNGSIDFFLNWKLPFGGVSGETDYGVSGVLTKVPSSSTSIYFRKVTHKDAAAKMVSTETQGMVTVTTSPTTCTVEASGGKANLALDRLKIKRSRAGSSKSFFKS